MYVGVFVIVDAERRSACQYKVIRQGWMRDGVILCRAAGISRLSPEWGEGRGSMTQHNSLSIPRPAKVTIFIVPMAPLLEQEREVEQIELAARIADL